jgi:tRNA threonylcarbamoyladenosine biosynthesis protein TsaE
MRNETEIASYSVEETEKIAFDIGQTLQSGDIICLGGDLGAGKTAFARGLIKALGVEDYITSPTFSIVNEYIGKYHIYHFDVYRIKDVDEILDVGFDEYIYGDGVSIIEWANKIKEILPQVYIKIEIDKDAEKGDNYRKISIEKVGC